MAHFLLMEKVGTRKQHKHLKFLKAPEGKMSLFSKLREMRILLIDDDEWIRDSLSLFFESEGCYLMALETAEEGLKELDRKAYDIIITDYKLPGMDGLQVLSELKADEKTKDIPVFMLTAKGMMAEVGRALYEGADEYITKPFDPVELGQILKDKLENVAGAQKS